MKLDIKLTFDGASKDTVKSALLELIQEMGLVPVRVNTDMPAEALEPEQRATIEAVNAPVTDEQLKAAAQEYMKANGRDALLALMKSYGIEKISLCPPGKRPSLLAELNIINHNAQ